MGNNEEVRFRRFFQRAAYWPRAGKRVAQESPSPLAGEAGDWLLLRSPRSNRCLSPSLQTMFGSNVRSKSLPRTIQPERRVRPSVRDTVQSPPECCSALPRRFPPRKYSPAARARKPCSPRRRTPQTQRSIAFFGPRSCDCGKDYVHTYAGVK